MSSREASLKDFPLDYNKTFYMKFEFRLFEDLKEGEEIIFDLVQENAVKNTLVGGERFLIVNSKERRNQKEPDKKQQSFDIVPNPNNGIFDIKLSNLNTGNYLILDIYGNIVLEGKFKNEEKISIDISSMNTKLFFVKIISGETTISKVLIKD